MHEWVYYMTLCMYMYTSFLTGLVAAGGEEEEEAGGVDLSCRDS